MADGTGRKLLEATLRSVATSVKFHSGNERMRAALAYALLKDGEDSVPTTVKLLIEYEQGFRAG